MCDAYQERTQRAEPHSELHAEMAQDGRDRQPPRARPGTQGAAEPSRQGRGAQHPQSRVRAQKTCYTISTLIQVFGPLRSVGTTPWAMEWPGGFLLKARAGLQVS